MQPDSYYAFPPKKQITKVAFNAYKIHAFSNAILYPFLKPISTLQDTSPI